MNILIQKGRGYHFGMKGHFYIVFNQPGKVDWASVLTGFVKTLERGPDVALLPNPVVLVWGRRECRSRQSLGEADTV